MSSDPLKAINSLIRMQTEDLVKENERLRTGIREELEWNEANVRVTSGGIERSLDVLCDIHKQRIVKLKTLLGE